MAELRIINQDLSEEKTSLNQRLDSIISCTQKDRVESNLHKLEIDSYTKQIEQLKMSEGKLRRQVNQLKSQNNEQLKGVAESKDKYAKELESNRFLEDQIRLYQLKLQESELLKSSITSQLEEKSLNYDVLHSRFDKTKQALDEKAA